MKHAIVLSIILLAGILVAGCGTDSDAVRPGEEFTLAPGETATIRGEDLEVTFLEVLEDSRCPKDVTCIWAGRARSLVKLGRGGVSEEIELVEPGLDDSENGQAWNGYRIVFSLRPYPESTVETAPGDYRLVLTVSKPD